MHACVRLELVNVVVMHGHNRGAGLAEWLAASARAASTWAALPLHVRMHALMRMPQLLGMLPPPAQDCLLMRAEEAAASAAAAGASAAAAGGSTAAGAEGGTVPLVGRVQLCAVCAGVAACAREFFRHTAGAAARDGRKRLQGKILRLLQKLLAVVGIPAAWSSGCIQTLPEPSDLRWRVICAALGEAAAPGVKASEGAILLLRRACTHERNAPDAEEEAVAAAFAVWSSARPLHTFPAPPSECELQTWSWACITGALSALPAKTLHEVLVAPASTDSNAVPSADACTPCMRWLAFGLVTKGIAVHRSAATQMIRDIAESAPVATDAETSGEWVAAAVACAAAVGADREDRKAAAEAVLGVLESAQEDAEAMHADEAVSSRRVRRKIALVALVAWYANRSLQDEVGLWDVAAFVSGVGDKGGGCEGPAWEMPLRVLGGTISAVVGVDGGKMSAGRDRVVQALFELWRELEVKESGSGGVQEYLVRPLQSCWQWLFYRDQALLVPYLMALES